MQNVFSDIDLAMVIELKDGVPSVPDLLRLQKLDPT